MKQTYNVSKGNFNRINETVGLGSRKEIYQQPIPIDTINKFWGIDSKQLQNDIIVQKQSFEQSYKNFWSFVDANVNFKENFDGSQSGSITGNNFSQTKFSGVQNAQEEKVSQVISYKEARERANFSLNKNTSKI